VSAKSSLREDLRPSLQFYVKDWLSDPGLHACSLAARGLWIDVICIMFTACRRGELTVNGKTVDAVTLAKIVGRPESEITPLLLELRENGVYSFLPSGTLYCRRMVREAEVARRRSEAGAIGAAARWNPDAKSMRPDAMACEPYGKIIAQTLEGRRDETYANRWQPAEEEAAVAAAIAKGKDSSGRFKGIRRRGFSDAPAPDPEDAALDKALAEEREKDAELDAKLKRRRGRERHDQDTGNPVPSARPPGRRLARAGEPPDPGISPGGRGEGK